MNQKTAHSIKHRIYANDEFPTPPELAKSLVALLPRRAGLLSVEPCPADGAFLIDGIEAGVGDFLDRNYSKVDWIITNPPYSILDEWLVESFSKASTGVALLLGLHNITPKRLELAKTMEFGLTQIHLCKVFHWFGISAFCVWEKGKADIVTWDRIVWR